MNIEIEYHYGKKGPKRVRTIRMANPKDNLHLDKITARVGKDAAWLLFQRNPLVGKH